MFRSFRKGIRPVVPRRRAEPTGDIVRTLATAGWSTLENCQNLTMNWGR
jgi:hypothetical protein